MILRFSWAFKLIALKMTALHREETNEDPQSTSEIVEENEDPDVEQVQQSEEQVEDEGLNTQEEEDESEERFNVP